MKQQLIPTDSDTCLALVKPRSGLARECRLGKPSFGIYEYDEAFGTYVIRWGDGSWHELTIEQHADLVLMPEYGKDFLEALIDR